MGYHRGRKSVFFGAAVRGVALVGVALLAGSCSTGSRRFPAVDGSTGDGATGDGAAVQCGNGVLEAGEECDDGNLLNGDGCSPQCQLELCDSTTCFTGCCDATGVCVDGVADTACGVGGVACDNCASSGYMCYQQECVNSDCSPGEQMDCGFCGLRSCQADGTYGDCEGQGVCLPDTIDIVDTCGNCGQLVRTCDQTCQYGAETCTGEGVCEAGTIETAGECGNCGQDQRMCSPQCLWDSWLCVGEGTCPGTGGDCCDGACTDILTDPDHCGGCNAPCGAGELCCNGDCADTQTDPDHCGGCVSPCNANQQCCSGSCSTYTCITGGSTPWTFNTPPTDIDWPDPPTCPAGSYTVGVLTQRHWDHKRLYGICVVGAQAGTILTCTGDPGVCTPAACPAGTASVGIFVDRSGALPDEQQRICVGLASGGSLNECDGPIGNNTCVPAACAAGDVSIGIVHDHDTAASLTHNIRVCVSPICPPPCP